MKLPGITIGFLLLVITSYCQDGSDIRYLKTNSVDSSIIGKYVHFDFYNRSFRRRSIDTVTIVIDGHAMRFAEVRNDNGYDNWFSRQSLQSIPKSGGKTTVISKFRLDGVTNDSF